MSHDVVIIGGGPAGAAGALACARRGWRVALVDPLGIGGQLMNVERLDDVPGHSGGVAGWDLVAALGEQVLDAGVELVMGRAGALGAKTGAWQVEVDGRLLDARAVLVATGVRPRRVPTAGGEELEGRGVSYCAACDAGLAAGRPVVVVGGGDTAMAEARTLAAVAEGVTVVFPEAEPPAAAAWTREVRALPNVTFRPGGRVLQVSLAADGQVELDVEMVLEVEQPGTAGAERLATGAVFVATGGLPASEAVAAVLELDDDGFVVADAALACPGAPGVFVAGDVRAGAPRQAVTALGEGTAAALAIDAYLRTSR